MNADYNKFDRLCGHMGVFNMVVCENVEIGLPGWLVRGVLV